MGFNDYWIIFNFTFTDSGRRLATLSNSYIAYPQMLSVRRKLRCVEWHRQLSLYCGECSIQCANHRCHFLSTLHCRHRETNKFELWNRIWLRRCISVQWEFRWFAVCAAEWFIAAHPWRLQCIRCIRWLLLGHASRRQGHFCIGLYQTGYSAGVEGRSVSVCHV